MPSKSTKNSPSQRAVRGRTSTRPHSGKMKPKEDLFDKAFRLSPHPIGITELDTGRCLDINDACLQIYGFQRHEVIGKTTLMLGIWPDPQERAKLIARLRSEGSVRNAEVSMRMKNKDLRHFLISTDLITLNGKRCLLTIGSDITERKQAEGALRELNKLLEQRVAERTAALCTVQARQQLLLQSTPMVLYARRTTGDFSTTFISENVAEQLGYSPQDFVEHSDFWVTRLHPDDRAQVLANLSTALEQERHVMNTDFAIGTGGIAGCTMRCASFAIRLACRLSSSFPDRHQQAQASRGGIASASDETGEADLETAHGARTRTTTHCARPA